MSAAVVQVFGYRATSRERAVYWDAVQSPPNIEQRNERVCHEREAYGGCVMRGGVVSECVVSGCIMRGLCR